MKTMTALLLGLAAASPLTAQDTIKFKNPKKSPDLEGEIVTLTFDLVEIEVRAGNNNVKQSIDARSIQELIPRKSLDFARGEEALASEDFGSAIGRFERVAADTQATDLLRQQAAMMLLRTHVAAGNPPGVVDAAQALRKRHANGFYVGESYALETKARLAVRDQAGAKAAIAALSALGRARAIPDWVKSADLLDAALAELQTNWKAALATYRKYIPDAPWSEEATLGELRCLTAIADFPLLAARSAAILKADEGRKDTRHRLLVAAYTARGDVQSNAGSLKDALFDYLYGAMVLGVDDRGPEHETALARSVAACSRLAAAETDPARQRLFRARAREQFQELRRTYPRQPHPAPPEEPR
jgi:hypothetical protein